ncbi:MAG: TIGR02147 family protein [Bdellovibrio sp.]
MISMMTSERFDFVALLNEEFSRRVDKNSKYSLRAFARDLQIEPSLLSKILRGQHGLTLDMLQRLSRGLGFSEEKVQSYAEIFLAEKKRSLEAKRDKSSFFSPLALDHLSYLSDWYHLGILTLLELPGAQLDTCWMAQRLNISEEEAQDAFERLIRLGYVVVEGENFRLAQPQYSTANIPSTNEALQKMQTQFLEKAIGAIGEVPYHQRGQATLTFSLDPKLLPKLKDEIMQFLQKVNTRASTENRVPSEVYNLSVSLYPVTQASAIEEKNFTESLNC